LEVVEILLPVYFLEIGNGKRMVSFFEVEHEKNPEIYKKEIR
jgi:hypothetical protein